MLHKPGVTQRLARLIVETRWEDIPSQVQHQAKRSFMNFFAVALAGCRSGPVEIALRSLSEFSGGRQATLIGRTERIDALSAAFLNAAGANVHDFCDTHLRTVIHPTAPVAPALLALAELRPVSGPDLLLAFILGNEVQARIGLAISPSHYSKGWHITSSCGVFGAASGAGKLLKLDERRMVWALGNASTQSSGLCECLGTPAKSISVGNAARNGLWSALLAEQGFDGPPEPLAGVQGFYNAMGETPDLSSGYRWPRRKLGDHGHVLQAVSMRLCHSSGAGLRARLAARQSGRRSHARRGARQPAAQRPHRPAGYFDRARVAGERAARRRRCLGDGQGRARSVHRCLRARSKGAGAAEQGRSGRDPAFATIAAAVEITTADGKTQNLSQPAARGSDVNPMSDTDLEKKLRSAATGWNPRHDVAPLIDAIWALDSNPDVSRLASLAVPRG